jgi:hypothetical protein
LLSVGTQLTCTYADDNGDTPAYVEITSTGRFRAATA